MLEYLYLRIVKTNKSTYFKYLSVLGLPKFHYTLNFWFLQISIINLSYLHYLHRFSSWVWVFLIFALKKILDSHSILSHLFPWRTLSLGRSYILKIVGFTYILVIKLRAIPFSHFRLRSMFFFRLIKSNPSTSFLVLIGYNQNGPSYYYRIFQKKNLASLHPSTLKNIYLYLKCK